MLINQIDVIAVPECIPMEAVGPLKQCDSNHPVRVRLGCN
jgi:hypothetical protein